MDGSAENACSNCGGVDHFDDDATGDCICGGCGMVQSVVFSDARPYRDMFDVWGQFIYRPAAPKLPEPPRGLPKIAVNLHSAPYSEQTYLNERIAQWRHREPPIPYKDTQAIIKAFAGGDTVSKDEIRNILAQIDKDRVAAGKKPRFIRKYLEKWLTIRYELTGDRSRGYYAPETLVLAIRKRFAEVLPCFKRRIKGNGRYSIISINFLFRRFFDLEDEPWFAADFPPLKTDAKRKKLVQMWTEVCLELDYPYINSDYATFPTIKFYQPVAWSSVYDGRGRNTRFRKRRLTDTYDPALSEKRFNECAERYVRRRYGEESVPAH